MGLFDKDNKPYVVTMQPGICKVPRKILEAAKNLDQDLEEMIQMFMILWNDGSRQIVCPYYNENSLSKSKGFGCYPAIDLKGKIEEDPERLHKMVSMQFGCKCQYDK